MYQSRIRNVKRGRQQKKKAFVEIEEGQQYGIVQDLLGNGRVNAYCEDGKVKVARIRGSMRKYSKKVIINKGDLVLVSLRDFGDDKVDLFHKYSPDEVHMLLRNNSLPLSIVKRLQAGGDIILEEGCERDNNYVVFMEGGEDSGDGSTSSASDDEGRNPSGAEEDDLDIDAI